MRVDRRGGAIQQRAERHLANISRTNIPVRLAQKGIRSTGVISGLGRQGGGWDYLQWSLG